ncbi:MAG: hypothetical protein P9M14_10640 [Candidatus Alcyoniella australis]|nr:hypothetical protein [Candidatus Alcyoniella australis]
MRRYITVITIMLSVALVSSAAWPHCLEGVDDDALEDMTPEQISQLCSEGLLLIGDVKGANSENFVQSLLIFQQSRDEVYQLLCATERQIEYLPRLISATVVERDHDSDTIEFYVGASIFKFRYRVDHEYDRDDYVLKWDLDDDYDNEVRKVSGSYKLYELPGDRTFARYATVFSISGAIPQSIQNALAKGDMPEALASLKKWVDSGGVWRRPKN